MNGNIGMRAALSVAAASIVLAAAAVAAAERAPQHRAPATHRASTSAEDWIRALHIRSEALNEHYGLGKP